VEPWRQIELIQTEMTVPQAAALKPAGESSVAKKGCKIAATGE
jgi:hypothetical protein